VIGYVAGSSPLHRAHPYTPLAVAAAILLVAFTVTGPLAVWSLVAVSVGLALLGGVARPIAGPALVLVLPIWVVLFVLHGLLGDAPRVPVAGAVTLSEPGIARAMVLGGRIGAIVIASLVTLATISPARLVEAMTDRGVPFGRIFLLVSTLTFLPRTRLRARGILEAQQARGLRLRGSPAARFRALGPVVLPLVLGALAEVDEQVLALDARGATSAGRRTALDPPPDSAAQRALRWSLLVIVIAAFAARFSGVTR
jgi:energy-coupling factor transport system permease protein